MTDLKLSKVNVAVVQMTPVFFDNRATLSKIESTLSTLKKQNCKLVLFPESLLPGYPRGFTFGTSVGRRTEAGRNLWLKYYQNSICLDGEISKKLAAMSKDYHVHLVVGVTERDKLNSSLYCSVLHYAEGNLLHVHRKIKPTGTERVIWAEGDGTCIRSVDTEVGRIGSLICWENYMPEARMKLYKSGLEFYLAPTADARDTWIASMRHIACESRSFVLSSNQYFRKEDYEVEQLNLLEDDQPEILCRGGSCIVSPYGEILAGPIYDEEATLLIQVDLAEIIKSRLDFDVIGHYRSSNLF
ncbi:MAG: carbon-nitrogen hydrolase family protein [Saprospiraceae bacterium]|nr:carbon-nitrogen hydrolase family protein [Saprospiraceae bacterium]